MSASSDELARLRDAIQKAWDAANLAGLNKPQTGTPEWHRWQALIDEAIAAADKFFEATPKR